jgi:hypothetical protein
MTVQQITYTTGVACDKPTCTAKVTGKQMPSLEGKRHYVDVAVARGWSVWRGRNQRHYCPDHWPSKGHTMQLLKGGAI